jgi:hypothetical protein
VGYCQKEEINRKMPKLDFDIMLPEDDEALKAKASKAVKEFLKSN